MAYTLNEYTTAEFSNPNATRAIIYTNDDTAARLQNLQCGRGSVVIKVVECLPANCTYLPMPHLLMEAIDVAINRLNKRALVLGLDAYLALLDASAVGVFRTELQRRLDDNTLNVDYLLSTRNKPNLAPRYEESRRIITITNGIAGIHKHLSILAYPDRWARSKDITDYNKLLNQMDLYEPSGNYFLVLPNLTDKQAGLGKAISFVFTSQEVAAKVHGLDAEINDMTLDHLLQESARSGEEPVNHLIALFGPENIHVNLALKRLLELPDNNLWPAYIWLLRKRLPRDSYIANVLSLDITHENLLRKYVVDSVKAVMSEVNANKFAIERAESLKSFGSSYESLIVELIDQTRDTSDVLQFLNCDKTLERIEILRRLSEEDLTYGIPEIYGNLFPTLADYFSTDFNFEDERITDYFYEYRKLKILGTITDRFVRQAFELEVPKSIPERDTVIQGLREQEDVGLLVIDAMGVEYLPLLLAIARRREMRIESLTVATAKLPTDTRFNPIAWDKVRVLAAIKSIDNIVHDGESKYEMSLPERNFEKTLHLFETKIMNSIAEGLTTFSRVVVTADHGASRLAVIANDEGKSTTLAWDGQPDSWRYSRAPRGVIRPIEMEQAYFPETQETYWIVRGYNRLPKKGGKIYELHGGATLEERLVPIIVFTKNTEVEQPKKRVKKPTTDLVDEFEGLI